MSATKFFVTGDPEADAYLADDPLALLIGMLLDQQVKMEAAFRAPFVLRERLGGKLDAPAIAAMPTPELEAVFAQRPALHRFPGSMARRTQDLCAALVADYDGDAARVWTTAGDPAELSRRLQALPGFGKEKASIFLAVLGKRFAVAPSGWEAYAGRFADDQPRSVADIHDPASLERVRAFKKVQKAAGKGKGD